MVRQAQIEANLVEVSVGPAQVAQTDFVTVGLGLKQRFLKVKRRAHQPLRDRAAVDFRKAF